MNINTRYVSVSVSRAQQDAIAEDALLLVAISFMGLIQAATATVELGRQFRTFHDQVLVPQVHSWFTKPEPVQVQAILEPASKHIALLPPAKEVERVLTTPCVSSDRILVTPHKISGFTDTAIAQIFEAEVEAVPAPIDYESMSVTQLRKLAKGKIKNPSKLSKVELIAAIASSGSRSIAA